MRWRFTDRVLSFTPWQSIVAIKAGSLEEYSLLERWGSLGEVPAIITLEAYIQASRWLVEASSDFALTIELAEIEYWQAIECLKPGERLTMTIKLVERSEKAVKFNAGEELSFTAKLVPLAECYLPQDRKCLWQEIFR